MKLLRAMKRMRDLFHSFGDVDTNIIEINIVQVSEIVRRSSTDLKLIVVTEYHKLQQEEQLKQLNNNYAKETSPKSNGND